MTTKYTLDTLIPFRSWVSWRDWEITVILIALAVVLIYYGISAFWRFCNPATKTKPKIHFAVVLMLIASSSFSLLGTAAYKTIQEELYRAEEYEEDGNYHDAYTIYTKLRSSLGEYQDLDKRIDRCVQNLSVR